MKAVLPTVGQIVRTEIEDEALIVQVVVGAIEDDLVALNVQAQLKAIV